MRNATIERTTAETRIRLQLELDGQGEYSNDTGVGFLNHMLDLFARHGHFDLRVQCDGDTEVDDHHSVEDIGIALGEAFSQALGDKHGIRRYGSMILPMDEALMLCAVDLSGRGALGWQVDIPAQRIGSFDAELVKEFWLAFTRASKTTIHFKQFSGENSHHIVEAMFKAAGRALDAATSIDARHADELPTTKGML